MLSPALRPAEIETCLGRSGFEDYEVGCIMLSDPFFLEPGDWIEIPGWHPNIQKGKGYDLTTEPGATLWRELSARLQARAVAGLPAAAGEAVSRYGEPILVRPRLGQGSFRAAVLDAYGRRCAPPRRKRSPCCRPATSGRTQRAASTGSTTGSCCAATSTRCSIAGI